MSFQGEPTKCDRNIIVVTVNQISKYVCACVFPYMKVDVPLGARALQLNLIVSSISFSFVHANTAPTE